MMTDQVRGIYSMVVHALHYHDGAEHTFENLSNDNAQRLVQTLATSGAYTRVWITESPLGDTRPPVLAAQNG
jgi:hypothetical protein